MKASAHATGERLPELQSVAAGDPRAILDGMIAAYRQAESYADQGVIRVEYKLPDGSPMSESREFSVAFARPNRLRLAVYQANAVCDGKSFFATIAEFDKQVLVRPAPEIISEEFIYRDRLLNAVLSEGIAGQAPQLKLLLEGDPLKDVLGQAKKLSLMGSETIDGRLCDGVQAWNEGRSLVFWVDHENSVLRRLEYPVDANTGISRLVADFTNARIEDTIPDVAFQFDAPVGSVLVGRFVLPPLEIPKWLGQKPGRFNFTGAGGSEISDATVAGKITAIEFWFTASEVGARRFAKWKEFRERFHDRPDVQFITVNVDDAGLPDRVLAERLNEWGLENETIHRDPEQHAIRDFECGFFPQFVLLSADGRIQARESPLPGVTGGETFENLPSLIDKLLAGQDLAEGIRIAHARQLRAYEEALAASSPENVPENQDAAIVAIPPRTAPARIRFEPLWTSADVQSPGNILVDSGTSGSPRIFVVEGAREIVELDSAGQHVANYLLGLPDGALITFLRAGTDAQGKRFFAGSASMQPQVHVFDGEFHHRFSYPEAPDVAASVADAHFINQGEQGESRLVVGFWGDVGVHGVDLSGKRAWFNRSLSNVSRVVAGAESNGLQTALCTHEGGSLIPLGVDGTAGNPIRVGDFFLFAVYQPSSPGERGQYLGLTIGPQREVTAVGFNDAGKVGWTYELPTGSHRSPIEPVACVHQPTDEIFWYIAGPDGSIHLLRRDGSLFDRFQYGQEIRGIAVMQASAGTVLIVATPTAVEAWRIGTAATAQPSNDA